MIEAGVSFRDFALDNPIRAIREVSHDVTGKKPVRLAVDVRPVPSIFNANTTPRQSNICVTANADPQVEQVVDLWGRTLDAVEAQDFAKVDTEIDWVIKRKLFQRYQDRHGFDLSDPKIAQLDLAYHDIKRGRGVFDVLQRKGLVKRVTEDETIDDAVENPPQTHARQIAGRLHHRSPGSRPGLHSRLGSPQAQRSGARERCCARTRSAPSTSVSSV